MPIVGMKLDSITGSREKGQMGGEVKINSMPKIVSVKEITVPGVKKKAIAMGFEFTTNYDPSLGMVKVEGEVLYASDSRVKILSHWKKNKRLPKDVDIEVLNHLFRHSLLKISNIAEMLQLPPPLRFPVVRPKEDQTSYIG
jgi:hypothetical protein